MNNLSEILFEYSLKTFEELAFFMPVPEENPDAQNCSTVIACVEYFGHSEGVLYINVTDNILPLLAQNILAEENIPKEQQLDALKEVANVICGNLLPSLAGKDKKYRLKTPEIVDDVKEEFKNAPYEHVDSLFYFDEGTVKLCWYFVK